MRERPCPCVFATYAEVKAGRHITFEDDAVCNRPACRRLDASLAARRPGRESGAGDSALPGPTPSPVVASSLHRTALARDGGTFSTGANDG